MSINWPRLAVSNRQQARTETNKFARLSSISPSGPSTSSATMSQLLKDLEEIQALKPADIDAVALLVSEKVRRLRRNFPLASAEWANGRR